MQPRIVFRTHYQVDEPAYMELLVKLCTSPSQSAYAEVVAQRLANEIDARGRDFNTAAGRYAVDLATALGLITANHTWSEKGQLTDLIAEVADGDLESQLVLTLREKLLHFRLLLEADGGAFRYLARRLVECGALPTPDADWNSLAKDMFSSVYSEYLKITNNTAERVALRRQIDRIKASGYQGNTGPHKLFVHLQPLYRLGLIARPNSGASRTYTLPSGLSGPSLGIQALLDELPDASSLEGVLKAHEWIDLAAKVFQIPCTPYAGDEETDSPESLLSLIVPYYAHLISKGVPLCPLSTVIEAAQIDLLAGRGRLLPHDQAMKLITNAQKAFPKDIRFHVDRRGQPAFLKMSETVLRNFCHEKVLQ